MKQPRLLLFTNPATGVANGNGQGTVILPVRRQTGRHMNTALLGKLQRITYQVGENLPQSLLIDKYPFVCRQLANASQRNSFLSG